MGFYVPPYRKPGASCHLPYSMEFCKELQRIWTSCTDGHIQQLGIRWCPYLNLLLLFHSFSGSLTAQTLTYIGSESFEIGDKVHSSGIGLRSSTACIALLGDITALSCLDVIIRHVASVLCLIPNSVTLNASSFSLTTDVDLLALGVGLDNFEASARSRATVDTISSNWK